MFTPQGSNRPRIEVRNMPTTTSTYEPLVLVDTADLPEDEWLEYRRRGIGGSDASTIIGLNPYNSLFRLFADKKGFISAKEDNEAMRQGRDFEEYAAKRFCEATGKNVRRRNYMFQHDNYDYILADIDREVVGENAGLECKTTSLFNKSDFENGEIPLTYYVQMMHYSLETNSIRDDKQRFANC